MTDSSVRSVGNSNVIAPRRALMRAAAALLPLAGQAALTRSASAQSAYPARPVRLLVGDTPGGATDITARIVIEGVTAAFPRSFTVEDRPGAGHSMAAEATARAAPDGYQLLIASATGMAIAPVLYRLVAYDPARDFTPIALLAEFPFVIVVHPSIPVRTLPEFVDWARAQPDAVIYGSPNAGSQQHLGMEQLAARLGFKVSHVGFRGGGPTTTALLAGQIMVGSIGLPPLVPHLREGRIRALAVSTGQRSALAPDVPTIGMAENTLVVVASDHGDLLGDHGLLLKGPMAYDGLLRVVCMMRGPGVPKGRMTETPVSSLDLPATFLDIAGVARPAAWHSRSLLPVARGEEARDFAYCEWDLSDSRCGVPLELRTVRTARDKLTVEAISGAAEMYDLAADPQEMHNIADDPAHAARRRVLEAMIASRPADARTERLPAVGMA